MTYIENIFLCMVSPLLVAALCMGRRHLRFFLFCIDNDFSISNVVDITKLGLMELTRKKKEKSLEEIVNEKKDDN